jgi:hypothetical protein
MKKRERTMNRGPLANAYAALLALLGADAISIAQSLGWTEGSARPVPVPALGRSGAAR